MPKIIDLTGKTYGLLTVLGKGIKGKQNKTYWLCLCECGKEKSIASSSLTRGYVRSCGCFSEKNRSTYALKHGLSFSPEYRSWIGMKNRCNNVNYYWFSDYGGRGITVCERWTNSFENFLLDMGKKPSPKYSIDRIDNNGNYEPNNCKWSTRRQQSINKRNTPIFTYNGLSMSLIEWSEKLDIKRDILAQRINKMKWSIEKAFTTPIDLSKSHSPKTLFNSFIQPVK